MRLAPFKATLPGGPTLPPGWACPWNPSPSVSGSSAPGAGPHHLSNRQLSNGEEVPAAVTWRGPTGFRAASLPCLINGHFNRKGNKNCVSYTMAIIYQYTHSSLKR